MLCQMDHKHRSFDLNPSEQSFSQGFSSQHGMFSQLSQNSLSDVLTNDQRFGSQERENSVKKIACLPPISHAREESQMQISRSSTNFMRKWSSASGSDHRCQTGEDFEHRIGMMETSLNKFGMILDSVQSDVMQVNKGMKEVSMEMEAMRQKLTAQDNSLQLMSKGQEDFKASLDGGIKSMSEQLSKNTYQDKLQEMFLVHSALPEKIEIIEASLLKSQNKLHDSFIKEMQKMICSQNQNTSIQKCEISSILSPKLSCASKGLCASSCSSKTETGGWKTVKAEKATFSDSGFRKVQKPNRFTSIRKERECRVVIESDEEIDGAFSCLLDEKETDVDMAEEVFDVSPCAGA
ncbi:hypothetical protein GBA52_022786 [Prunus armeniaca]|nr:hypothetical protein GBA52_022786 [Prunus armeniaca]